MRSYHQFCGLAKALDLVGDRWTLLIVRELLLQGPARYSDLQRGLPGIATNLLGTRLRELIARGIVERRESAPPVATPLFALTAWGEELRPIVLALGRWAGRTLISPAPRDRVRSHWLALPLEHLLVDRTPQRAPVHIELRTGERPVTLEVAGEVRVHTRRSERPDAVLIAPPHVIIALLAGRITLAAARARGLRLEGDASALKRVRPSSTGRRSTVPVTSGTYGPARPAPVRAR